MENIKNQHNIIHLMGVGGAGMAPLAELYLRKGYKVSGCDREKNNRIDRLIKLGLDFSFGHSKDHLKSIDKLVYTRAIDINNPELKEAKEKGIDIIIRGEALVEELKDRKIIGIAGTHGKTTTTAMLLYILKEMNKPILGFIGGDPKDFDSGFVYSSDGMALCELDESDKMLLLFKPFIGLITSIEKDHIGKFYKDEEDIYLTYKKYIENSINKIIMNIDKYTKKLSEEIQCTTVGFDSKDSFQIQMENDYLIFDGNKVKINMTGEHNLLNAAAALATVNILGYNVKQAIKILYEFKGISRRMEKIFSNKSIQLISDYGHHPTEINYAIETLKKQGGELLVIFQPHLYSRTKEFYREFSEYLSKADKVILMPIYPAREKKIKGISSRLIYNELKKKEKDTYIVENYKELYSILKKTNINGTVLILGAGDLDFKRQEIIRILNEKI